MQAQASILHEPAVSFVQACILSFGLLAVIFGQIGIYAFKSFKKSAEFEIQLLFLLLLILCSSGVLLGVVVSKIYGIYIGLLLLIPNLSGLCELEALFRLSKNVGILTAFGFNINRGVACITIIAQIIGFAGSMVTHENPQSVWIVTLFITSVVLYVYLCLGHLIIFLNMEKFRWIFLFQGVLIILIFIPMAVFASSLGGQIYRQTVSVWVLCGFSAILRFRLPIVQLLVVYEQKADEREADRRSGDPLFDQTPTSKHESVRGLGGTERCLEKGVSSPPSQAVELNIIKSEGSMRDEQPSGNQVGDQLKKLSLLLGHASPPPHLRSLDEIALSNALEYMSPFVEKLPPPTYGRILEGGDERV